jgi:hypothetical protein
MKAVPCVKYREKLNAPTLAQLLKNVNLLAVNMEIPKIEICAN